MKILIYILPLFLSFNCSNNALLPPNKIKEIKKNFNTNKKVVNQKENKQTQNEIKNKDTIFKFEIYKIGQKEKYTGKRNLSNNNIEVTDISIKKISSNKIEYNYNKLINWKKNIRYKGVGKLIDLTSIKINSAKKKAYKFYDYKNNLVIYLTKDKAITNGVVIIYKKDKKNSPVMHNK